MAHYARVHNTRKTFSPARGNNLTDVISSAADADVEEEDLDEELTGKLFFVVVVVILVVLAVALLLVEQLQQH